MFQYVYKASVLHLFFSLFRLQQASRIAFPTALYIRETYISAKEPDVSAKEPCISAKEPYISAKEPCISAKTTPIMRNTFCLLCHASRIAFHTRIRRACPSCCLFEDIQPVSFHFILCYVQYVFWFPLLMRRACSSYFKFEYVHDISFYMLWGLRSVGLIKLYVSFAKYRLLYRAFLQKRPII